MVLKCAVPSGRMVGILVLASALLVLIACAGPVLESGDVSVAGADGEGPPYPVGQELQITGVLFDDEEAPFAEACVLVRAAAEDGEVPLEEFVVTDDDGSFELFFETSPEVAKRYDVEVLAWEGDCEDGEPGFQTNEEVETEEPRPVEGTVESSNQAGESGPFGGADEIRIDGQLLDQFGEPYVGACLHLTLQFEAEGLTATESFESDENGEFGVPPVSVHALPGGAYQMIVEVWESECEAGEPSLVLEDSFRVE